MLVRLADWCYRRRRLVVAAWIVALLGSFALAGAFGGELRQDYLQPGSESKAAADTLEESFPQAAGRHRPDRGPRRRRVSTPEVRAQAEKIFADVADERPRRRAWPARSPTGGAAQISEDGRTAYADVALDQTGQRLHPGGGQGAGRTRSSPPGTTRCRSRSAARSRRSPRRRPFGTEGIGLIAAAIILLVTFGSAVAMGLPLITALFGLGIALALGERAAPGRRRAGLGAAHGRDGRPRRRHRLRPAHRHPVPQQPRRGPGPRRRHR